MASTRVVPRNGTPYAALGITVHVHAADQRLDQMVRSFDFGALAKLLAR